MSLGQIVALLVALFVVGYGIQRSLARRAARALAARRAWPWAEGVPPDLLTALVQGVEAYAVKQLVSLDWATGRMVSTQPPALVSLNQLAHALAGEPSQALRAPVEAVDAQLTSMLEEDRGVLRLDEDWYEPPFRSLSADQFTDTVHDVLTSTYARGLVHHKSDAMLGYLWIGVEPSEAYTAETVVPSNELWISLREVLARCHNEEAVEIEIDALARRVLQSMIERPTEGCVWLRGQASQAEREVILAGLSRSK